MHKKNQPILYFDGTCVLCNYFFKWILKKDTNKIFRFATLQSNKGQKIIHHLKITSDQETVILELEDTYYTYSSAALKVLILLGGWKKILGIIGLLFPKFIRDKVYNLISKYRYNWFGQQACLIPDASIKKRFVDA